MDVAFLAVLGVVFGIIVVVLAWRSRKWRRAGGLVSVVIALVGVIVLLLGTLGGVLQLAARGYTRLTQETLVATVETSPQGPQQFRARFVYADGGVQSYDLSGDALYVDAHIVKWHPVVNILGLHTTYRLDRVAGRYDDVGDETRAERTVYALAPEQSLDLFKLARVVAPHVPIVDAEYGSASFVPTDQPATYELYVSTSGLLFRPKE